MKKTDIKWMTNRIHKLMNLRKYIYNNAKKKIGMKVYWDTQRSISHDMYLMTLYDEVQEEGINTMFTYVKGHLDWSRRCSIVNHQKAVS